MAVNRSKILRLPLFITIAVLIAIFLFFSFRLSNVSADDTGYDFSTEKISAEVKIYKDRYGLQHIVSANENDLYYAIGFSHAQNRLWQMDILRRKASGRLSEILGKKYIDYDMLMKKIGIPGISYEAYRSTDEKTKSFLRSYAAGVNKYIELSHNKLSFEFSALAYKPEKWLPEHSYQVMRFFGLSLSQAFASELKIGRMKAKLLPEKFARIIRNDGTGTPLPSSAAAALAELITRNFVGPNTGSNIIAIDKNTENGSIFLANDPHMELALPALWTETIMTVSGFNICGLSIPGIPLPLIGRNDSLAWGIANAKTDDFDFYLEKTDNRRTWCETDMKGGRHKIDYAVDSVKVAGRSAIPFYRSKNDRSCFLNKDGESPITFDWTGRYRSDEFTALHKLAFSREMDKAKNALASWGTPCLMFALAGGSGLSSGIAGFIPERSYAGSFVPLQGNDPGNKWNGMKRRIELTDKTEGYYVFANNHEPALSDPASVFFDIPVRKQRLEELISEAVDIDRKQLQIFQNDVYSDFAEELADTALHLLRTKYRYMQQDEKDAFARLKNWNFILSGNSPETVFYGLFASKLFEYTFSDELGEDLYAFYRNNMNLLTGAFLDCYKNKADIIFDDVSTSAIENRDYMILKAFKAAVSDFKNKKEERRADLVLEHMLSYDKFIRPLLHYSDIVLPGDATTVNYHHQLFHRNGAASILGVSARFITDVKSSFVYFSLPGGTSGDPISSNFADQLRIWSSGGYISVELSPIPSRSFSRNISIRPA